MAFVYNQATDIVGMFVQTSTSFEFYPGKYLIPECTYVCLNISVLTKQYTFTVV